MILDEVLLQLVPFGEPDLADLPAAVDLTPAQRIVGGWSALTRAALARRLNEDVELRSRAEKAGAIGVGLIRGSEGSRSTVTPQVEGYQFGVALYVGNDAGETRPPSVLGIQGREVPLFEVAASFEPQSPHPANGRIAVYFEKGGNGFAVTAMHAVVGRAQGQRVDIDCPHGAPAELFQFAPGLIDAAILSVPCMSGEIVPSPLWPTIPGSQVSIHAGAGNVIQATVVQSVSTSAQILSAAVPEHFLLSDRAFPGASGSLVAGTRSLNLHGMYLGSARCKDRLGGGFEYGFGIELGQVADIFDISRMMGAFDG